MEAVGVRTGAQGCTGARGCVLERGGRGKLMAGRWNGGSEEGNC